MGRGSWYSYPHHVLYDYDELVGTTEDPDDFDEDEAAAVWDEFVENVLNCFDAYAEGGHVGREAYYIGGTTQLKIGIDTSGGYGCIFLEPRYWRRGWDEIEYKIDNRAKRGLEKLMKLYPGILRFATSDFTSGEYKGEYNRHGNV